MVNGFEKIKNADDKERIRFIQKDKFVLYPKAVKILNKLEELVNYEDVIRPPSFLIVGEPNNGKTMLARYFYKKHEPYEDEEGVKTPVLFVQAPNKPDVNFMYDIILDTLTIPYRKSEPLSLKFQRITDAFKRYEIKLMIIDEIHNILSGTALKQREFMNGIKNLVNATLRPIVLIGTKDALIAVNTDYQISSRFKPEVLERWMFDENYLNFLRAYERILPLRKNSNMSMNEKLSKKILEMSEGYIGEIVSMIKELAIVAIKTGKEKIDESLISQIDWIEPSKRNKLVVLSL
ncbi:MAG: TniB family NTP-binding protein [Candidatus Aenigmatarchaeota archaeon]